jgi:hypothetical protein
MAAVSKIDFSLYKRSVNTRCYNVTVVKCKSQILYAPFGVGCMRTGLPFAAACSEK